MLAELLLVLLFKIKHVTERGKQGFKILPVGLVGRNRRLERGLCRGKSPSRKILSCSVDVLAMTYWSCTSAMRRWTSAVSSAAAVCRFSVASASSARLRPRLGSVTVNVSM